MLVRLMHPDRDVALGAPEARDATDLAEDLELDRLWDAAAGGDELVHKVVRWATLHLATDPAVVRHRHDVLTDCRELPGLHAELEEVAARALTAERRASSWLFGRTPSMSLHHAVQVLGLLLDDLDALRAVVARYGDRVRSAGWRTLVETVRTELDDAYLTRLRTEVEHLRLSDGIVHSARLAPGGTLTDLVLRRPRAENHHRLSRNPLRRPTLSWTVPERDESGSRALGELDDRVLADVAAAALDASAHVLAFFAELRVELAFYRGCVTFAAALEARGTPWCLPSVGTDVLDVEGLVDPCLVLRTGAPAEPNDVALGDARLLVVTGANHGGKSTLLRALGVLQLCAQAGLPVAAVRASVPCVTSVHTHWAREEDAGLRRGKLDDELARMAAIVDEVGPDGLVLSNESFSSTDESEGAAIALDVVRALLDAGVRVHLVTHLYDLARPLYDDTSRPAGFLRAPRQADAATPYRLEPGEPLPTSFGRDLYEQVFGAAAGA